MWRLLVLHIFANSCFFIFRKIVIAILVHVQWYVIVILICISLTAKEQKYKRPINTHPVKYIVNVKNSCVCIYVFEIQN